MAQTRRWSKSISLDDVLAISPQPTAHLVAVDDALNQLAKVDEHKSQVGVLRFFGGLSVEETAEVLKVHLIPWLAIGGWSRRG
jgi:RNA polymerase sigma-70 factor (ECF subfamily)